MQSAEEARTPEEASSPAGAELVRSFRQYLMGVGPAVLQLQGEDQQLVDALDDPEYAQHVSKFLTDISVSTLYIEVAQESADTAPGEANAKRCGIWQTKDRKSTRLNSSH